MEWLTKYFNKPKQISDDDSVLLNHIKERYDFDEVIAIKKDNIDFSSVLVNVVSSIIRKNDGLSPSNFVDTELLTKGINQISGGPDYFIVKMTRNYMMSKSYEYALFLKHEHGYTAPFNYLSHHKLFGEFPEFEAFNNGFFDFLERSKDYYCVLNGNQIDFKPSYSFKFPIQQNSLLLSYDIFSSNLHKNKQNCSRDLEVIVEVNNVDKIINYTVKLFYKNTLLRQENNQKFVNFNEYLDNFLFPYNLKYELICEIGLSMPFEFTPEFLARMNPDVKTTVDMINI